MKNRHSDCGAALVEASLVIFVFLVSVYFLFQIAFTVYMEGRAQDIATTAARHIATHIGTYFVKNKQCVQWQSTYSGSGQYLNQLLDTSLGSDHADGTVTVIGNQAPWGIVQVDITVRKFCLGQFFCKQTDNWTTRATAPFEKIGGCT